MAQQQVITLANMKLLKQKSDVGMHKRKMTLDVGYDGRED